MLLVVLLGLTLGPVRGDSSQDTPSKLNKAFLKSRTASRDLSFSSSFGSENFDTPDISNDNFHAKYGINKTWGLRTPHPVLSRRATYEDYGRAQAPDSAEGDIDTSELFSKTVENPWEDPDEKGPRVTSKRPQPQPHQQPEGKGRPLRNGKEKREVVMPSAEQERVTPDTTAKAAVLAASDVRPSSPTVATSRRRTRAWGPPLPKMVPGLCVLLAVGAVVFAVHRTLGETILTVTIPTNH